MSLEANKTLVRRYFEEFLNQGNLCVADEIFDASVSYCGPFGSIDGVDRLKRFFLMVRKALPDLHYIVDVSTQFPELMCLASGTERLLKCAASGIRIARCSSSTEFLSLRELCLTGRIP